MACFDRWRHLLAGWPLGCSSSSASARFSNVARVQGGPARRSQRPADAADHPVPRRARHATCLFLAVAGRALHSDARTAAVSTSTGSDRGAGGPRPREPGAAVARPGSTRAVTGSIRRAPASGSAARHTRPFRRRSSSLRWTPPAPRPSCSTGGGSRLKAILPPSVYAEWKTKRYANNIMIPAYSFPFELRPPARSVRQMKAAERVWHDYIKEHGWRVGWHGSGDERAKYAMFSPARSRPSALSITRIG